MKVFIGFILGIVLLTTLSPSNLSAHPFPTIIKMTNNTFEPNMVTADTNSTITFINQDDIDRWPASNLHPTHEEYAEFDPKKPIKPGESWTFNPKSEGAWKYHDHLNPHIRGTLTIVKTENSLTPFWESTFWKSFRTSFLSLFQKIVAKKASTEEFESLSVDKQIEVLENMAEAENTEKAWFFLSETYKDADGVEGNVHDLAHLSGKLIFEEKGLEGISVCTPVFAFGCYHGLLDAAFATNLDNLAAAEAGCEGVGRVNSGPYASCIHGIGHGIASFYQTRDLEEALDACGRLSNGHSFCYDGVFMEFVRGAPDSFYKTSDPFFPCNTLEKENGSLYSEACGRNQSSVFILRLHLTLDKASILCGQSSLSEEFKNSCYSTIGFILARTQNPQEIISGCRKISHQNYQFVCLKSAAGELIFQNVKGWQEKSKLVCDSLQGQFLGLCHTNLQRLIREYGR